MKKVIAAIMLSAVIFTVGCNEEEEYVSVDKTTTYYARMEISLGGEELGEILIKLFAGETPNTVENFAGLVSGTKEYQDPQTGEWTTGRFYDGLIFHRVIDGFMIQGGDPLGTGRGGPGYRFDCEIVEGLGFDRPGILAMANAGPNTNGSQFFITVSETPWLNGRHTIFGEVTEGMDYVYEIANTPTGPGDSPAQPVVMERVEIIEK